jgi:hypothetical protein
MFEFDDFEKFDSTNDIFDDNKEIIDGLEVVNIDIDAISNEADGKAKTLIEDLTKFYYDEEFLKSNPNFRKRVDNDMESLRMLLKMRSADEVTHDILIRAIAANSGNASLYGSLTRIQDAMLKITTKIESIVTNLTNMIKGYQLEINWKLEQDSVIENTDDLDDSEDVQTLSRGSKEFIQRMSKIENNNNVSDDI